MRKLLLSFIAAAAITLPAAAQRTTVNVAIDNGTVSSLTGEEYTQPNYRHDDAEARNKFPNSTAFNSSSWVDVPLSNGSAFYYVSKWVANNGLLTIQSLNTTGMSYFVDNTSYNGWDFYSTTAGLEYLFTAQEGYIIKSISFNASSAASTNTTITCGGVSYTTDNTSRTLSWTPTTDLQQTSLVFQSNPNTSVKMSDITVVLEKTAQTSLKYVYPDLTTGSIYQNDAPLTSANYSSSALGSFWGITNSGGFYFGQQWMSNQQVNGTPIVKITSYGSKTGNDYKNNIGYFYNNGTNYTGWCMGSSPESDGNGYTTYKYEVPEGYSIKMISFIGSTAQTSTTVSDATQTATFTVENGSTTTITFQYDEGYRSEVTLNYISGSASSVKMTDFVVVVEKVPEITFDFQTAQAQQYQDAVFVTLDYSCSVADVDSIIAVATLQSAAAVEALNFMRTLSTDEVTTPQGAIFASRIDANGNITFNLPVDQDQAILCFENATWTTDENGKTTKHPHYEPDHTYTYSVSADAYRDGLVVGSSAPTEVTLTTAGEDGEVAGIDSVAADSDNAPARYYNLTGVEVKNPTAGVYIRVQGDKASKVLVK